MTTFWGRASLLQRIEELLHGRHHVSIVGARAMGKTSLLQQVVRQHAAGSRLFAGAGVVDLRHNPPTSTHATLKRVGEVLRDMFRTTSGQSFAFLADEIDLNGSVERLYDQLKFALDIVAESEQRLLLALDGCDAVLQNPEIPIDLWNSIRALAQRNSLSLMTGTRDRLVQLCYNPEARDSPFFNIFYSTPLLVGPFNEADWGGLSSAFGMSFDAAAMKEVVNWTGGNPSLVSLLLERILESAPEQVQKRDVDEAANGLLAGESMVLEAMWRDGGEENRGDIVQLTRGELSAADFPDDRLKFLLERGIAVCPGSKVKLANRFIERLATRRQGDVSSARRLFEQPNDYESNIRSLLELRLVHVGGGDPELRRLVKRAIQDVSSNPAGCLGNARDIVERALEFVWNAEAPDGCVPEAWVQHWKFSGVGGIVEKLPASRRLPSLDKRGEHCAILRLATGTVEVSQQAKWLTKPTFVIIEFLVSLGNARNHRDRFEFTIGFSAAFCMVCVELIAALYREFDGVGG
ncbi:ATP-binding protein [Corallococcus sp. AB032C]|uniref:AAA family ATPase n=1 Tax=Corallococcus TaxID=83461 RepID=UPI000EA23B54|nr:MULTISPECIES: ATP-binding protein [Corallococcus]NPC48016.1 ATP-binding protein [Corallococcus exiguus]RKH29023.1 ATP-binding protein [Corallococcus sp. CA041A]RKH82186.1 ATP-binding protein [Corallococcus sp. AB032C]RKH96559.1 ATP-binding protein [Corallococcus sp. AB038B]